MTGQGPRILVTLPDVAQPADGGKRLRCAGVLRGLAAAGRVDLAVLFSTAPEGGDPVPPGVEVQRWLRVQPAPRGRVAGAATALARRLPVHVGAQRWDVVEAELGPWLAEDYDLVWFGGLDHARALHPVLARRFPRARWVVDCDDVETEKWRAYLEAGSGGRVERVQRRLELPLWQRIQDDVAGWADAVVVCSELDAQRFGTGPVAVLPNTYPEPASVPPPPAGEHPGAPVLALVANWGTDQNVDAAGWGAREVLPAVRRLLPGARLRLVGREAHRVAELADLPGVEVVGPVEEVGTELAGADVVVVPMRYGGGTRLKVLEAFAHRRPVVSTTLGSEGTGAVDGEHLLLRDDAAGTAEAVARLVKDAELRDRLVDAGEQLYRDRFRPAAAVTAVGALVDRLLPGAG
ncbi:glycosyltransferase family 4 protein [Klenkia brasiliensis]|uniref:Glycosyl transferases group 1 n=1 Tax=Klenkia brasiliensis TaxID=333142 RepID=A0A1G7MUR3_9ACTN|nr:glycosyltransferase family 4 protein [Klenkia brasiliensis]SDF65503.1 Glycosyl transferases group 1 [Klenkia brasiliensis]